MGIPIRRTALFALTGIGGLALLMDRTLLSDAGAAAGSLTDLVSQVQSAQEIAGALDSGDPAAIQGLLETLLEKKGTDPTNVQAGLFGLGSGLNIPGLNLPETEQPKPDQPAPSGDRVSMIIATAGGGLAVINGKPMRIGQEVNGIRLVEVHPNTVVIEDDRGLRTISLR